MDSLTDTVWERTRDKTKVNGEKVVGQKGEKEKRKYEETEREGGWEGGGKQTLMTNK